MARDPLGEGKTPTRRNTAQWVALTGGAQGLRFVLSIASIAILGRLLPPDDFGLVATAAPFLALAALLQGLGLNQALVQRSKLELKEIHALFYLSLALSIPIALALYFTAPLLAEFFNEPRLVPVVRVMSGLSVAASMSATPIGILSRKHRFGTLAAIDIGSALAGFCAGVAIAVIYRHYWAIVAVSAVTTIVQLGLTMATSGWRPGSPSFNESTRQMLGFGAGFSMFNVANFFSRNADNWLIARFSGMTALGLYDRAYKLMLNPLQQSIQPFSKVMVPVLSRLQDDGPVYASRYFETTFVILLLIQPPLVAATMFAQPAIIAVLGERWAGAGPIFFYLSLTSLHHAFTSTLGWLFISQGRGWDFAFLGVVGSIVTVTAFSIGVTWGPVGVAAAYAIADYAVRAPLAWFMAGRTGHVRTIALGRFFLPHAFAMALAAGGLWGIRILAPEPGLLGLIGVTLVSYLLSVVGLSIFGKKRTAMAQLWSGLQQQLRRAPKVGK